MAHRKGFPPGTKRGVKRSSRRDRTRTIGEKLRAKRRDLDKLR